MLSRLRPRTRAHTRNWQAQAQPHTCCSGIFSTISKLDSCMCCHSRAGALDAQRRHFNDFKAYFAAAYVVAFGICTADHGRPDWNVSSLSNVLGDETVSCAACCALACHRSQSSTLACFEYYMIRTKILSTSNLLSNLNSYILLP
jgi:hypothetical protein